MKAKTLLYASIVASIIVTLSTVAICMISFHRINMESANVRRSAALSRDLFETNLIIHEYLIYREKRPLDQWRLQSDRISSRLNQMQFVNSDNHALLAGIKDKYEAVKSSISSLVSTNNVGIPGVSPAMIRQKENRLQSRILVKTHDIYTTVVQISRASEDYLQSAQKSALWGVVAAIFFLSLVTIGFTALTAMSILKPLNRLRMGTETVAKGNLDYKVETKSDNEIGKLTGSFNQMVNDLKSVMISRDELERGIARRTSELSEVNVQLQKEIAERKEMAEALEEQLEFERLIADIAALLAHTRPEQLEASIDSTLQTLGRFLKTERAFLGQFSSDRKNLQIKNIWAAESITLPPAILEVDFASDLAWPAQHIRAGGVIIAGPGLAGLPDEAKELRHWLERNGISSGVVVPVNVQDNSIGMLGLDTLHQPREYPPSLVNRLKIVADMIGSTLRRVQAQEVLYDQLQFEDLMSKLSATFIHIKASAIDSNIERGLQLIAEFLDIQRGNLFQFSCDHEKLTLTHSFASEGVKTSPQTLFSDQYPWFTKKLLRRESICFSNLAELPKEAIAEKKYLVQQGIISVLIFPLVAAGVTHGTITFSSLKRERQWPDKLIQQFKILSEVFSNALLRKRADEKIGEAFSEIKRLKDRFERENFYLRKEIEVNYRHEEIVGKSKPVMEMLSRAEQVAETDATVLLLGETGTGKELLARSIHNLSRRKNRQMIKVNCAALPPTLIESELFGREKGAFTGAMTRQIGRFEIADKSTIFLDEIGELPLDVQAKLLRVLQEGQFERLGNPKTISVNVRILASTNRDLAKAAAKGRFREDLYYRLNVFSVNAPPLRDRPEDIPLLVWTFVKDLEKSMGKSIEKIPQKSIDALLQYSWPGNIRELRNAIENAMIISTGKILKLIPPVEPSLSVAKDLKLEVVERNHIIDVLEKTSWRVSGEKGAAKLLGLKPTTLESRMKKLGITRPR